MHGAGVKTDPQGAPAYERVFPVVPAVRVASLPPTHVYRSHTRTRVPVPARPRAGNLFEGEWREGKPIVKNGDKQLQSLGSGAMDWLNEAVANVSSNFSSEPSRGNYHGVSTHDEDDDYRTHVRR